MIIMMLGPQASGKGTQAQMLGAKLGLPAVPVGALLRDIPPSNPNYDKVNRQMQEGVLVDYDITAAVILDRVSLPDCRNGYILDGWGRILDQFEYFNPPLDYVIDIHIPREEVMRRVTGRRVCDTDGKTYNIYTLPEDELAQCKGGLVQRKDDTEEAVNVRWDLYQNETIKVIEHYKEKGILLEIDGVGTPEQVFAKVLAALSAAQSSKQ